jgi:peptide/nickel transport system substrate-binding protein
MMIDPTSLGRRKFLVLGGLGSAALALGACSSADHSAAAPTGKPTGLTNAAPGPGNVATGRRGGSVTTVWTSEGNSYDAAIGYDLHSWDAITNLLYQPLYQFQGQSGASAPAAAAALPQVSSDGLHYVVSLNPDVKFHNGRPVVAEDYVYAWRRVLDPATQSWAAQYFMGIKGAADFVAGNAAGLTGLRALDQHTLSIELDKPDITFLGQMTQPYSAALPREEVERLGDQFGRTPVGNGPFRITAYDTKNQMSVFERNPFYHYPGLPFLDGVTFRWGLDPSLQYLQLRGGDVDIIGEGLTPSIATRVQGNSQVRETFSVAIPTLGAAWIGLNVTEGPLADRRVRQALNWATDRDQLARFARGLSSPWGAIVPADEPDYRRTAALYGYDLERARNLMREAGVSSMNVEFVCSDGDQWVNASQILQQQWALIGVNITVTTISSSAFWDALDNGQAPMEGRTYFQVQPTSLDLITDNFTTGASSNYQKFSSPEVDALVKMARESRTVAESNAHLAAAEKILVDEAPGVYTGNLRFIAMRSPRVNNYYYRAETGSYYDRMWV